MFPDTWPKFKTGSKQKQTKSKFRGLEMCAIQLLLSPLVVSTLFLSLGKQETTKGTIWFWQNLCTGISISWIGAAFSRKEESREKFKVSIFYFY